MALRRSADVIYEVVDDRAMLVTPDGSELLSLNAVGTMVWERIDEHDGDAARLAEVLLPHFEGVERGQLERDIAEFLDSLLDEGLVYSSVG